jgi:ribosomal protein S18
MGQHGGRRVRKELTGETKRKQRQLAAAVKARI